MLLHTVRPLGVVRFLTACMCIYLLETASTGSACRGNGGSVHVQRGFLGVRRSGQRCIPLRRQEGQLCCGVKCDAMRCKKNDTSRCKETGVDCDRGEKTGRERSLRGKRQIWRVEIRPQEYFPFALLLLYQYAYVRPQRICLFTVIHPSVDLSS